MDALRPRALEAYHEVNGVHQECNEVCAQMPNGGHEVRGVSSDDAVVIVTLFAEEGS